MVNPPHRQAAVVGAGIGGLAAGIALTRAGWDATVYEAADEIRPLGAGLSIWPNGVHALRALGLGELAERAPRSGGALRRADGSVLVTYDPEAIAERFGAPLVGMHRADLHDGLIAGLGSERLRLGMRLVSFEDDELRFADGTAGSADLVVGADGINSTIRAALIGDGEPRDSGYVAYRGVSRPDVDVEPGEWWAPGCDAGLLPLGDGRVYWYLAYRGDPDPSVLESRAAEFDPLIAAVIGATPADAVLVHRLQDRAPVAGWSRGRATLLGDAAHPMLPFLGQGACAALEDAVALGRRLADEPDPDAALAAYERERFKRTEALVKGSRRAARVAIVQSALGSRLRNALLSRAPESARLRQLDRVLRP
jgi:2-polyprenyl-6-methoxyphenol hydroxylase-like FAD-dependent oxidoreductase